MAKTREIKGRMKAVSNIKRITRTMQLIATARFQAALKRATAAKPYTEKIAELVGELAGAGGDIKHPLLETPEEPAGKELLLILTAERGLCGGYNANILRTVNNYLKANTEKQIDIEMVGKKGVAYCKFNEIALDKIHTQFGDKPSFEEVETLANDYMERFTAGKYDSVKVIFMQFETIARQKPVVLPLLPLQPPQVEEKEGEAKGKAKAVVDYDFSPEPAELLGKLLPATVRTELFQCFNDAIVGEQVARMIAMKSATDAAGKMGKSLTRQYNRARQTAITTELTEIIGGTAALE